MIYLHWKRTDGLDYEWERSAGKKISPYRVMTQRLYRILFLDEFHVYSGKDN